MKFLSFLKQIKGDAWAAILLFLLTLDMYHPGLMSNDAILMFREVVSGQFRDSQPPIMTLMWFITNKVYYGPMGMLVFHAGLFWTALFLLARKMPFSTKGRVYFMIAFGFFPAVFNQIGNVAKDVGLGATLFLASVLLVYILENPNLKRKLFPLVVLCVAYGMGVRLNSFPAAFLICLWAGYVLVGEKKFFRLKPIALGACLGAFLLIILITAIGLLIDGRRTHPGQTVEVFDLAAISLARGEVIFPDYAKKKHDLTLDKLRALYQDDDVGVYFWPQETIPFSSNDVEHEELRKMWLQTSLENIPIYLKHRLKYFWLFLVDPRDPLQLSLDDNPFGLHFRSNWIWRAYYDVVRTFQDSFVFKIYPYVLALLIVFLLSLRTPVCAPAAWIGSSGLVYVFGYFFYGPNSAFRYAYWSVLAVFISGSLLWRHRKLIVLKGIL